MRLFRCLISVSMWFCSYTILMLSLTFWLTPIARADTPAKDAPVAGTLDGSLAADWKPGKTMSVNLSASSLTTTLNVSSNAEKQLIDSQPKAGDLITLEVDDVNQPTAVTKVDSVKRVVPQGAYLGALIVSFITLIVIASLVTGWRPQRFIIGMDNRVSNSQTQLVLWLLAVLTVYIATLALRRIFLGPSYIGYVSFTGNLLTLTGLSALTYGGAKMITTTKTDQAGAPKPPALKPQASDLVLNDNGNPDVGDLEMILITVIAVVLFLASSIHFLSALEIASPTSLPDVDTTLLSLFGVGQGAYLVKKGASDPGKG